MGEPVPAGERVAEDLRRRITEGHLPPGTQLRDVALAAEMGVARHTLRGALRLLEYEGLLTYQMHKGVVVKALSTMDVREIYRVRRTLELSAIEHSALVTEGELSRLDATVRAAELAVSGQEWNRVGTASLRFHQALVALLGSSTFDQMFRGVLAQLRLAFAIMPDEQAWQTPWIPRDREICDLVRGGRRDSAKALLRQYLDDSERGVLDVVRARGNEPVKGRQTAKEMG
ncbi:GntR family transcriptional regulator [Fodinicola acaciae]|uniref:GntR family transcriptional regulator n=1 Tax=Fodinicola acaciae TaxID=2681555 RepID=UPI0013D754D7|nr:GntR family transcriptional regulator [Fodinicola acaciae]